MTLSLYEIIVPSYLQILVAVQGLLEKGEAFCAEKTIAPAQILEARLAPDMLPFTYQIKSTAVHSLGAIEGVRRGEFSPDRTEPPGSFAALKSCIADTVAALHGLDEGEVNSFVGRDMHFVAGAHRREFTAQGFLLSFSLPNFHFHATTAYDILRWKGVSVGKRDFLGPMRKK